MINYFSGIKYAHYETEEILKAVERIKKNSNGIEYYADKLQKELQTTFTSPYYNKPKGVYFDIKN